MVLDCLSNANPMKGVIMAAYVLVEGYDYDGEYPIGVFESSSQAQKWLANINLDNVSCDYFALYSVPKPAFDPELVWHKDVTEFLK